jgi:hypothetical protein
LATVIPLVRVRPKEWLGNEVVLPATSALALASLLECNPSSNRLGLPLKQVRVLVFEYKPITLAY